MYATHYAGQGPQTWLEGDPIAINLADYIITTIIRLTNYNNITLDLRLRALRCLPLAVPAVRPSCPILACQWSYPQSADHIREIVIWASFHAAVLGNPPHVLALWGPPPSMILS